jgi:hypothetical protein
MSQWWTCHVRSCITRRTLLRLPSMRASVNESTGDCSPANFCMEEVLVRTQVMQVAQSNTSQKKRRTESQGSQATGAANAGEELAVLLSQLADVQQQNDALLVQLEEADAEIRDRASHQYHQCHLDDLVTQPPPWVWKRSDAAMNSVS